MKKICANPNCNTPRRSERALMDDLTIYLLGVALTMVFCEWQAARFGKHGMMLWSFGVSVTWPICMVGFFLIGLTNVIMEHKNV